MQKRLTLTVENLVEHIIGTLSIHPGASCVTKALVLPYQCR